MTDTHSAEAYLVVKADTFNNGKDVRGLSIVAMRKSKPYLEPDERAVKVRVVIPDSAFTEPLPTAEIIIPESAIIHPEVVLELPDGDTP